MNLIFSRYISYTLLALFFAIIFSCSKSETKKYTIGFAQTGLNDEWRRAMNQSMRIQASMHSNLNLIILDGEDNIENQTQDIEELIKKEVDLLIVSPVKSRPITPIVEKAYNKGIPVLIVDRKIDSKNYTAFVGGDNYQVGKDAANYLASVSKKPKKIIEIRGLSGSSPAKDRSLGFNNTINKIDNLEVVKSIGSNWESYSIKDSLRIALNEYKDVDFIFAHNDRMALGAWEVAKENNLHENIEFIGVDGLPGENGGIKLVQDDVFLATILYPTGGNEAISLALKILEGQTVPKNNILKTTVIDSRNADIMSDQFNKISHQQQDIFNQQITIKKQEETYSTQSNILKLLLGLLITSLLLAAYSVYSGYNIRKQKRALELQNKKITIQRNQIKKIAEEVKLSNEAKVNFFTGLSHEFKTPITLILSSIESLSENKAIRENKLTKEIGLIFNNSKRLLRLINQLLDFRKVEDKKFNLRASKTNLLEFSTRIFKDFEREVQKRSVKFSIESNNEDLSVFIDRNLMDKVYFNLLSNAFKFTPNNGAIIIKIEDDSNSNFVKIYFKDSGIGIPSDELKNVFKPFFRGSNNNQASSGIGLYLSKQFVDLHKGKIEVSSKNGTDFILTLYKGKAHLSSDEIVYEPDIIDKSILNFNEVEESDTFNVVPVKKTEDTYVVLLVEDNPDLIALLRNKLETDYEVHVSNGTDAIEKAMEIIPDIIICDVNLPDKDGFEICEILKKDLRTSHIPTIMLTALDNKESYIKGLQSGADLYLTKPFSFSVLSQSIKTMLYNREKLRYYFVNNVHKINSHENFGNSEQDFVLKINKVINDNLDNSKFSVESLAESLNISRVQLYRKLKAILGISVSDYILNFRLDNAKVLLKETNLTISEIAYSTGFSSPNYFSTSFKSKFEQTPKAFRES